MSGLTPVGVQVSGGIELCGCGHPEASHFPACLETILRTENRWGGGRTVVCGCANFGSPDGIDRGRRVRRYLVSPKIARLARLRFARLAESQP